VPTLEEAGFADSTPVRGRALGRPETPKDSPWTKLFAVVHQPMKAPEVIDARLGKGGVEVVVTSPSSAGFHEIFRREGDPELAEEQRIKESRETVLADENSRSAEGMAGGRNIVGLLKSEMRMAGGMRFSIVNPASGGIAASLKNSFRRTQGRQSPQVIDAVLMCRRIPQHWRPGLVSAQTRRSTCSAWRSRSRQSRDLDRRRSPPAMPTASHSRWA